jgi:4-amino-4-deoxy-L-arabinose transferase-like glycosyltransferase
MPSDHSRGAVPRAAMAMTSSRLALAVAGLGLAARFLIYLGTDRPVQTWEYEVIAQNLLAGHGFGLEHSGTWYRTFGSPPFAYLCALLYLLFGHHHVVVLVAQWFFSGAAALGCYALGRRLFSAPVGVAAAALVSFHPGLLYYDTRNLHPLSFDAALIVLSVVSMVATAARPSLLRGLGAGLLQGLAVFERASLIGLPVAFLAWVMNAKSGARGRTIAAFLIGFAAIPAPWLARSAAIYGYPVITSTTWEILWRGNNPLSDGGAYARDGTGRPMSAAAPRELREELRGAGEIGRQGIFARETKRFVREHPDEALRLFLRKLAGFWWFMPQSGLRYPRVYLHIYAVFYVVLSILSVVGLGAALKQSRGARVMALTIIGILLSISLVQSIFYVEIRHRWSVEPIVLVFTAAGCATLIQVVTGKRVRPD